MNYIQSFFLPLLLYFLLFFPIDFSTRFLQDLEHRLEADILRFDVCDIVLDHCPALRRVYLPYVTNQAYQEQTYQRLL